MAKKFDLIDELVTANRILANEGIVDSFGHVSVRHPRHKDRYLLSRARAPERIEPVSISISPTRSGSSDFRYCVMRSSTRALLRR